MELTKENKRNIIISLFGDAMKDALVSDNVDVNGMDKYAIADIFISYYSVQFGNTSDMAKIVETCINEAYSERMSLFDGLESNDAKYLAGWAIKYFLCNNNSTMNTQRLMTTISDELRDKNKKFYYWRGPDEYVVLVFVDWGDTNYWFQDFCRKETLDRTLISRGIASFQKSLFNDDQ
jgi:hypothetical protein